MRARLSLIDCLVWEAESDYCSIDTAPSTVMIPVAGIDISSVGFDQRNLDGDGISHNNVSDDISPVVFAQCPHDGVDVGKNITTLNAPLVFGRNQIVGFAQHNDNSVHSSL